MDYSIYLSQPFFFVLFQILVLLVTVYSIGSEFKFGTTQNWMRAATPPDKDPANLQNASIIAAVRLSGSRKFFHNCDLSFIFYPPILFVHVSYEIDSSVWISIMLLVIENACFGFLPILPDDAVFAFGRITPVSADAASASGCAIVSWSVLNNPCICCRRTSPDGTVACRSVPLNA